jgi:hypothetical protein
MKMKKGVICKIFVLFDLLKTFILLPHIIQNNFQTNRYCDIKIISIYLFDEISH